MEFKHICYICGELAIAVRSKKTFFKKIKYFYVCPKHSICTDAPILPNPYLTINGVVERKSEGEGE